MIPPVLGIWPHGASGRRPGYEARRSRRAEKRSWSPQAMGTRRENTPAGRADHSRSGSLRARCHPTAEGWPRRHRLAPRTCLTAIGGPRPRRSRPWRSARPPGGALVIQSSPSRSSAQRRSEEQSSRPRRFSRGACITPEVTMLPLRRERGVGTDAGPSRSRATTCDVQLGASDLTADRLEGEEAPGSSGSAGQLSGRSGRPR